MRTNVVIDDKLMNRARKSLGAKTKKATIEAGLRLLVQVGSQAKLKSMKGRITWTGDLATMRQD
ncbi:MAG: type II toxin-antitoxin system VapB family antitoxin [bacterium]